MKTRQLISIILALFVAASCTQTVEEEKYGEIAGIVYDNNVGEPISVAQVNLSPGGNSTVTGTDGSFSFTNIEAGNYTVSVTKKGYSDGSNTVSVVAGRKSDCNILLTRIPAFVTADKDELDFGDNITLTTLSFNIVNSSYENLSWHIDYDKSSSSFIAEVSPEQGTTQYGKTAAIVVKIDREKLNPGQNESTLVVVSDNGDGSSEVKVKAIGQEKAKASLNVNGVTDITSSTAIVHGEITFVGTPSYTERGFVYATFENPTIDVNIEKVTATVTEETQFSNMLKDLSLGVKYYVRAFAINSLGVAYSSNQESFTTIASLPVVSVSTPDHIDASRKTATLHGSVDSVGDPAYSEKGFVYCEGRKTPTIDDKYVKASGTGVGTFDVSISELKLGSTYYVRSYAKNEGGIAYSENTVEFTLNGSVPVVSMKSVLDINRERQTALFQGSVDSVGEPPFSEKGFVFSTTNNMPTVNDNCLKVSGFEAGNFEVTATGLTLSRYYVRAYAKNEAGIAYSKDVVSFEISGTTPLVSVNEASDISLSSLTAVLNGYVSDIGYPAINERGFVFSSDNSSPTINDSKAAASGSAAGGAYSVQISNLLLDKTYYVKAYVRNADGLYYSGNAISFSTAATLPTLSISQPTDLNTIALTATVSGIIESVGNPPYTEKGFVYSYNNAVPTVENDKVINVSGTQLGTFSTSLTNLVLGETYYVRAFAKNAKGIAYSNVVDFVFEEVLPTVTTEESTNIDITNKTAILHGTVLEVGNPSYYERGFVLSTNHEQPTIEDTKKIVSGTGKGSFEYRIANISISQKTFVRAYAINNKGIAYGETTYIIDPEFYDNGEYIIFGNKGLATQKEDIGRGNYETVFNMCKNSRVGSFADWRIPTREELLVLYYNRSRLDFPQYKSGDYWYYYAYWSSEVDNKSSTASITFYYILHMGGDSVSWGGGNETNTHSGRCVRSLE